MKASRNSSFYWNTGEPSIFYSAEGHRAAQRLEKVIQAGKTMDARGRATSDLAPRTAGGISIGRPGDVDKTRIILGKPNHARSS